MKKAFLVVGRSNWGKSETLKQLTAGNRRLKYFQLDDQWYFIKRMSNDDDEKGLIKFIDKNADIINHDLIIAFCPEFEKPRDGNLILKKLSKKYELLFFVIKHNYKQTDEISQDEIKIIKWYGLVNVYKEKKEAFVRAKALASFVKANS
jgi:hypothetical protein